MQLLVCRSDQYGAGLWRGGGVCGYGGWVEIAPSVHGRFDAAVAPFALPCRETWKHCMQLVCAENMTGLVFKGPRNQQLDSAGVVELFSFHGACAAGIEKLGWPHRHPFLELETLSLLVLLGIAYLCFVTVKCLTVRPGSHFFFPEYS